MKLNEADAKLVQRLRAEEDSWFWARCVALLVGFLMFAGSAFMFQQIWSSVAPDEILIVICILAAPVSGVILFIGLAVVAYAFVFWNGQPVRILLSRLSDESLRL